MTDSQPKNTVDLLFAPEGSEEFIPLRFHRRQLHRLEHAKGHIRARYGGTMSAGFKRGSIVHHPKWGFQQ